jgi:hypothetical protein
VWQQKTAFMQGIALPQKQQNQRGMSTASGAVSAAYGNLSQAELTRANAKLNVAQFNEAHSNDQINAGLGLAGTVAGAYLGGGMGVAPKTGTSSTPQISDGSIQFNSTPTVIDWDAISTDTRDA